MFIIFKQVNCTHPEPLDHHGRGGGRDEERHRHADHLQRDFVKLFGFSNFVKRKS